VFSLRTRFFRYYAEAIDKICGEVAPTANDTLGLMHKEPVGVVAAIVPFRDASQLDDVTAFFYRYNFSTHLSPAPNSGRSIVNGRPPPNIGCTAAVKTAVKSR